MDIISHYSAYTPAKTSAASQAETRTPVAKKMAGDEFLKMVKQQGVRAPDKSKFLYNGSETRANLSDTEVAVLANKYDPHNMDQETYDAFLDDLESMGAISNMEKQQMGYQGWQLIAFMGADGNLVYCGSPGAAYNLPDPEGQQMCLIVPWEGETDLHKWLGQRTRRELGNVYEPSDREAAEAYESLLKTVFTVVDRMQTRREKNAEDEAKSELIRQLADKNSDFYTNMRNQLQAQAEKSKQDKEEQDIIDAMEKVLDAMSGKKDVSGHKESVNSAASDLTKKIGDRVARLKREDPYNPEIVKLENMLKRLQEMGIYFDLTDMDGALAEDEKATFETLTQFLTRRQAEQQSDPSTSQEKEVKKAE